MSTDSSNPQPPPFVANGSAKRRKVERACDRCKSRKRRCDGNQPCFLCQKSQALCKYGATQVRLSRSGGRTSRQADRHSAALNDSLSPTVVTAAPFNNQNVNNQNVVQSSRATTPGGEGDGFVQAGQYLGPTSTFSFLRRASKRLGRANNAGEDALHDTTNASIFSLGDREVPHDSISSSLRLPDADNLDKLLSSYFDFAMPTYRFLHQPTISSSAEAILNHSGGDCSLLNRAADATLLIILATALLYSEDGTVPNRERRREQYFQKGQDILCKEKGMIRIESIQARLASVLYLLHTSRLNQAWYLLGTTQQLITALGLHRSRCGSKQAVDCITQECRRRCYWVAFTIDTYLSVMLGRPPLMSVRGVDQQFPTLANDENITAETTSDGPATRDCVEAAPVSHTKLALIMRDAFALHYSKSDESAQRYFEDVIELNQRIETWRKDLPLFLSGQIHPFSLIPIFRRQLRVLQMAGAHATTLVNRPLFFMERIAYQSIEPYVDMCLASACDILDMVLDLAANNDLFAAFWYFQYMTFHALSVVYIWIILRKTGRLSSSQSTYDETKLFNSSEKVQIHLAKVTQNNAPSLRYTVILQELRQETERILHKPQHISSASNAEVDQPQYIPDIPAPESHFGIEPLDWDDAFSFPNYSELWLQLDMFPFDNGLMAEDINPSLE